MKKLGKLFYHTCLYLYGTLKSPVHVSHRIQQQKILFLKFVICKVYKKHFYFDIRLFRGSSTFI